MKAFHKTSRMNTDVLFSGRNKDYKGTASSLSLRVKDTSNLLSSPTLLSSYWLFVFLILYCIYLHFGSFVCVSSAEAPRNIDIAEAVFVFLPTS